MLSLNEFSKCIIRVLTDREIDNSKVICINNKSLSEKGDLSFPLNVNNWRGYVCNQSEWLKNSKTILDFYELKKNHGKKLSTSNKDDLLLALKNDILIELQKINGPSFIDFSLKESQTFVSIILNRGNTSYNIIKTVIDENFEFQEKQSIPKIFHFKVDSDESQITCLRLNLIKKVTENLLSFHGHQIDQINSNNNYIITSKSVGKDYKYKRYLCGSVLNALKKKEKVLTEEIYLKNKVQTLKKLNSQRCLDVNLDKIDFEKDIHKIAKAAINYELLSTKHINPIIIENSDDVESRSIKEASFILYNYARMTAILEKYSKLVLDNELTKILPIDTINNFCKITDDESWSLVYNYILKFSDLLKAMVTSGPILNVNISLLWSFLSNLCHDFSRYYRRSRILIKGADSNSEIIQIMSEKLYMVQALRIILKTSLSLLDVEEVKSM